MKKKLVLVIIIIILILSSCTYTYINIKNIVNNDNNNETQPIKNENNNQEKEVNKIDNNLNIINNYINEYQNEDVVGIINIPNTDYQKAIMQSTDNDYYLYHTENKTSSFMGSIYLDFRLDIDNSQKLLIYGHNSSSIDMPFKILENYYDINYYKEHKYINILTKKKTRIYKIYSIFVETNDFNYMQIDFSNSESYYQHIKEFKNKSMYETGENVEIDDNILILQTCSTHSNYQKYQKKYLLIVAKEIK